MKFQTKISFSIDINKKNFQYRIKLKDLSRKRVESSEYKSIVTWHRTEDTEEKKQILICTIAETIICVETKYVVLLN